MKIGTREGISDLGRWSVGCSGVGRRRGGARDEEIWKGILVGGLKKMELRSEMAGERRNRGWRGMMGDEWNRTG